MQVADKPVHQVTASNTAAQSANKMHDDAVAARYGFAGALVPGVDVFAYMTHAAVAQWGETWLTRGGLDIKLLKPVYDGQTVEIFAAGAEDGALTLEARCGDILAATGRAMLHAETVAPVATIARRDLPADPPLAGPDSLASGTVLGAYRERLSETLTPSFLADIGETLPLYAEKGIAHPGYLLRQANYVLRENVRLGPWIHVASDVRFHAAVAADADIETRARVAATYERKGHKFTELDTETITDDGTVVMTVRHTAIYEPRAVQA